MQVVALLLSWMLCFSEAFGQAGAKSDATKKNSAATSDAAMERAKQKHNEAFMKKQAEARKNDPYPHKQTNEYKSANAKTKAEVDRRYDEQRKLKEHYKGSKLSEFEKRNLGVK
jgi:hypothetical protein